MSHAVGGGEESPDAAFYRRLKRWSVAGALLIAGGLALCIVGWNRSSALEVGCGGVAGALNAALSMHGNERLLDSGAVAPFVISSFVRIALFGIVPVVLAVRYPSVWTLGWYFLGFFTPLALSGIMAVLRER